MLSHLPMFCQHSISKIVRSILLASCQQGLNVILAKGSHVQPHLPMFLPALSTENCYDYIVKHIAGKLSTKFISGLRRTTIDKISVRRYMFLSIAF